MVPVRSRVRLSIFMRDLIAGRVMPGGFAPDAERRAGIPGLNTIGNRTGSWSLLQWKRTPWGVASFFPSS